MSENINEAILVLIVGMGGVFLALIFFYLVITLLNRTERYFVEAKNKKEAKLALQKQQEMELAAKDEIDEDELIAVITAAAYYTIQQNLVVKNIKFIRNTGPSSWAAIGRLNLIGSHNIHVNH